MNLEFNLSLPDPSRPQTGTETIEMDGTLDRVIYCNPENDFTVARFISSQGEGPVFTATGYLGGVHPGERLLLRGAWEQTQRFGLQFKVERYQLVTPETRKGLVQFLSSGRVQGIGPRYAERIVGHFGMETLTVLSHDPDRLKEVPGLGSKRAEKLVKSWRDNYAVRDIMMFLQGHGISAAFATRIFKCYGAESIATVKADPFRLAEDVPGIGFYSADRIARELGYQKENRVRVESGILHLMNRMAQSGHVYCPRTESLTEAATLLEVSPELVGEALIRLLDHRRLIEFTVPDEGEALYLPPLYQAETGILRHFRRLKERPSPLAGRDWSSNMARAEGRSGLCFSETQKQALELGLKEKILVLTGGPGTGKTTLLQTLTRLYREAGLVCHLAAPTGRAARRLSETSGLEARTIHRLLEYNPKFNRFGRDRSHPLEADAVLVDETSMVDLLLLFHLMEALPDGAVFILIGDADQLPSVGPGMVLNDLIASGIVPVVKLSTIFRQAQGSDIIENAHRINQGRSIQPSENESGSFFFIVKDTPEAISAMILDLVRDRIPKRFALDPIRQIQVLSPMHKTATGVQALNEMLQKHLNPAPRIPVRGHLQLAEGDKVMQTANDYEREIFNGDIGFVEHLDSEGGKARILFDKRRLEFAFEDLDAMILAYAVTIHKAQGSEYDAVVIPVTTSHYTMLQRNLLYTAVTRGKKLVVLVGTVKALQIAIKNRHVAKRYSHLAWRLAHSPEGITHA